jgi:ribosome-associated protein
MPAKAKKTTPKKTAKPATADAAKPPRKVAAPRKKKAEVAAAVEIEAGEPEGVRLAQLCCHYADEKKATDLVILDVRNISTITDYTVICTGTSLPHLRSIRREIADRLWLDHGVKTTRMDGTPESLWVVADFCDVMVHIFHQDMRAKFALEDLWSDAPRVPVKTVK